MKTDITRHLDGYAALMGEIAAARKYGSDFTPLRGRFQDAARRLHPHRVALRVSRVMDETPGTRTLRLVPAAAASRR